MSNSIVFRLIVYIRYRLLRPIAGLVWLAGFKRGPLRGIADEPTAVATDKFEFDGFVYSDYGVVIDKSWRLVSSRSPVTWGNIARHEAMQKLNFGKPVAVEGRVLLLSSHQHQNYFHWLFDVIARMRLVEGAIDRYDQIIINDETMFQRETLRILGLDQRPLIAPARHKLLRVPTLDVPPLAGGIGGVTRGKVEYLRRLFSEQKSVYSNKRLYLSRSDAKRRRVSNEAEVEEALRSLGFVTVTLSNFGVQDQVDMFRDCEAVVAPHGAGLANITFMPESSIVFELMPNGYRNDCFQSIAKHAQLRFFRIGCAVTDRDTDDISVNVESLVSSVTLVI